MRASTGTIDCAEAVIRELACLHAELVELAAALEHRGRYEAADVATATFGRIQTMLCHLESAAGGAPSRDGLRAK